MTGGGQTLRDINRKTVIASITSHLDARGAMPREGAEDRFPRSAIGLTDDLILRFQWRPLFCPKKREISEMARPRVSVNSIAPQVDAGDSFLASQEDSVEVLNTGATANLVCISWPARHNRILDRHGIPRIATYRS